MVGAVLGVSLLPDDDDPDEPDDFGADAVSDDESHFGLASSAGAPVASEAGFLAPDPHPAPRESSVPAATIRSARMSFFCSTGLIGERHVDAAILAPAFFVLTGCVKGPSRGLSDA